MTITKKQMKAEIKSELDKMGLSMKRTTARYNGVYMWAVVNSAGRVESTNHTISSLYFNLFI